MHSKPRLNVIGIFLISIILASLLGEGFLRLLPDLLPAGVCQRMEVNAQILGVGHPYIGHLHTPHNTGILQGKDFQATYHTDGHGFRNAWPWPEAADIVVIGDSFVFGYGVEDQQAWPLILNRTLPRYCILNLGLIGAGPEQYRRVYETFGTQMHPKVLLVGILMANDPWDTVMFYRWLESGAEGNYMAWRAHGRYLFTPLEPIEGLKNLGRKYSYFYNLGQEAYKIWRWGGSTTLSLADGKQVQLSSRHVEEAAIMAQPQSPGFQLVLEALTDIHSMATARGTHVLVVFQPSKEEVYMPLLGKPSPDLGVFLRATLDGHGIDYLDLAPAFQQRAQAGKQLFSEIDGHPNWQGYRLIAHEVHAHLRQRAVEYGLHDPAIE